MKQHSMRTHVLDLGTLRRAYEESATALPFLEDRSLVRQEAGGWEIFSPAFQRWILCEFSNTTRKADYAAWLEANEPYYGQALAPLHARAQDVAASVNPKYWNLLTEWLSKSEDPEGMIDLLREAAHSAPECSIWLPFAEE
jgi:hypothetical protein